MTNHLHLELIHRKEHKKGKHPWVIIRIFVGPQTTKYSDIQFYRLRFGDTFDTTNKFDQWFKGEDLELMKLRNQQLRKTLNELETAYLTVCNLSSATPTPLQVKEAWKNKAPAQSPVKLLDFVTTYCQEKNISPKTVEGYKDLTACLKGFLRQKFNVTDDSFLLASIDSTFIYRFEHYVAKANTMTGKRYKSGTAALYLSKLKAVLYHAYYSGLIKTDIAGQHQWTGVIKDDDKVTSTDVIKDAVMWKIPKEYLHKIEETQITGKVRLKDNKVEYADLKRTRLLFLFQTYTGLAFADLSSVNVRQSIRLDLNGTKSLIYNRAKNGELAIVPIFPQTEKLLEVLEYDIRPHTSYHTMQRKMKTLMRYYEVPVDMKTIGTHTGRHLFGSRMVHMGFSMHMISRMMGHTSLKQTEKIYARVDITAINADWERVKMLEQPTGEKLAI